jgi:uncharacterized protein
MFEQASQTVVDSLEFARAGQTLRGSVPISALARLHDSLYDVLGAVDFVVRGGFDARQRPTLTLEVTGVLHLRCQRCLGPLDYPLQLGNTLLLASPAPGASGEQDDDEGESIEPSAELNVATLVEDEIILGLPYSPRHPDAGCIELPGRQRNESAFAKLATLKRNLN